MRLCIPTMVWQRPEVFYAWAEGIRNLVRHFPEIDFKVLAVGSEGKRSERMVRAAGFDYFEYPNQPLTRKAQFRLECARETDADAVLFLGSDDIVAPSYLAYVLAKLAAGHDFIAPYDIYYVKFGELFYSAGYTDDHPRHGEPLAPGRLLSRKLLDKVNWQLWKIDRTRGLDRIVYKKLTEKAENPHFFYCRDIGTYNIDIKSSESMSRMTSIRSQFPVTTRLNYIFPHKLANIISNVR